MCLDMDGKDTKHQLSVQLGAYLESVRSIFFEDMMFVLAGDKELLACFGVGDALCASCV